MHNKLVRRIEGRKMNSKYLVLALSILLLASSSSPIVSAAGTVIQNPKLIDLHGPRVDVVNYQFYNDIDSAISAHSIIGNELSLSVAEINNFASDPALTTGQTPGFSNVGVYFNMLRPVTQNVNVRRGILSLQDYSGYYQTTMLSGSEGIATPSNLPCFIYKAACTNAPHKTAAENLYGGFSLLKAINYFKASESDSVVGNRLYEGNSSDLPGCQGASVATTGCTALTWHVGSASGAVWTPNWIGRGSLHRHDIAVYVQSQAAKIGMDFTTGYNEYAAHSQSAKYVEQQSVKSIIKDGVYNTKTGYNSAPVYNTTRATTPGQDTWDMYSYGFLFTANPLPGFLQSWNSGYGTSEANAGLYYNTSMDYATNKVLYAKTVTSASTGVGAASLDLMQNLPWINVYFENTLWTVLTNSWTGYANVPTLGPMSGGGLFFTLLNVAPTCFPASCENAGSVNYGLASEVDVPGGLTPMAQFNSVYDADMTNQLYDNPLIVGPTQYTTPGQLTNWMVTKNPTVTPFKGSVGPTGSAGFFMLQDNGAAQNIVGGQKIKYTFAQNIYFWDHVQMNAYDYNFSIYASDLTLPPSLPDSATPLAGGLAGPSGLIATQINPSDPFTIYLYFNSSSVWNSYFAQVPIIPQHIFKYFNLDASYSAANTFDTSFNYNNTILSANGCVGCVATNAGPVPAWLRALPNLEVGTGPFMLRSWDGVAQHGQLLRNPGYFRAAWYMNDTNNKVTPGSSFTFKQSVYEWTYSPTACASSADFVCKVPITSGITASLAHLNKAGKTTATFPLTCTGGVCSGSISTTGFPTGDNELVFTAQYSYLGLARTFYVETGILVHK